MKVIFGFKAHKNHTAESIKIMIEVKVCNDFNIVMKPVFYAQILLEYVCVYLLIMVNK
jgi:hypothetical protein